MDMNSARAWRELVGLSVAMIFAVAVLDACSNDAVQRNAGVDARAATLSIQVRNDTSNDYIVHVYDMFGGGNREVSGSPFALARSDLSSAFFINSSGGRGRVMYRCEGGPSLSDIDVSDGDVVSIN